MKADDPRHGTYAGRQQHRKEGKQPCKACREAYADYMREYRKTTTRWREQESARVRALWRLVDLHREEFDRLYVEERTNDHVEAMKRVAS